MRLMRWSLCSLVIAVAGCADAVAPRLMPAPEAPHLYEEVDPEQFPATIKSYYVTVGLPESRSPSDTYGTGWINAGMLYNGHHASLQVSSTLREHSGSVIQRTYPVQQQETWGFFDNTLDRRHLFYISSRCGGAVEAEAEFKAWFNSINREFSVGPVQMDQKTGDDRAFQRQCAPCPEGTQADFGAGGSEAESCYEDRDEPPPSGGGGGGCPTCLEEPAGPTYCRVRYWYWKDTGEVFNYTILWCA